MTARHRTKISDFVIIQTVPPYIIPIRRGAAVYSKKRGGGSIMKDKNTEKYNAAHKPEIRFGGTDDAGLGSAERGRHIVYPDIREESRRSAVISPRAVTPVHTADGKNEMLRCGRGGSRTARIAASDPLSCSSVCVSHQYDSARRSNTPPRRTTRHLRTHRRAHMRRRLRALTYTFFIFFGGY